MYPVPPLDGEEALSEVGVFSEMFVLGVIKCGIGVVGRSMGSLVWFMGACWG